MRIIRILLIIAASLPMINLGAQAPDVAPSPEMEKLGFLVGTWDFETVGLSRKGEVIRRSKGRLETRHEIGGLLLVSDGYTEEGRLAVSNWKFFHNKKQKLYDVQFDLAGNFEVREAVDVDGDLGFSLIEPFVGEDGVPRDWRKTYRRIKRGSYEIETHYTEDGGVTWVLAFREYVSRRMQPRPSRNQ
jgi:hypothetical protein